MTGWVEVYLSAVAAGLLVGGFRAVLAMTQGRR
ncbi:hypothetical protein BKA03_001534 [Demequina lutea]|uniref:Uncharacterized protein n=1 Tax=Demequina lutea TaxID=431489 RepID=A0A7Z0CK71_9MICO|nr:hypothetical protein [Demequina lutea]